DQWMCVNPHVHSRRLRAPSASSHARARRDSSTSTSPRRRLLESLTSRRPNGSPGPRSRHLRGCFVTGTDTGAGKTVVAAAIVAALRARGVAVRPLEPVITGLDEPPSAPRLPDHELLAAAAGCTPGDVAVASYRPPVSPHLAQELDGR